MTTLITIITILCALCGLGILVLLATALIPFKEEEGPKPGTPEYEEACARMDASNRYWKEYFEYQDILAAQKEQQEFNTHLQQEVLDSGQCPSCQPASYKKG